MRRIVFSLVLFIFLAPLNARAFDKAGECKNWLTELKDAAAYRIAQWKFTQEAMAQFGEANRALQKGSTEEVMSLLKSWGASNIPRDWIRALPIDWEALIKDASETVELLKPTEATTPKGQQSPYERSRIFQTHMLAMLMKLFRDSDFGPFPDPLAIQENWITWGMKQGKILPQDSNIHLIIARRAQMAFDESFSDQFVPSRVIFGEVESIRQQLDLVSPGSIAMMARILKRSSEDPEDFKEAERSLALAKRYAEQYFELRLLLASIDEKLHAENGKDRAYVPNRFQTSLAELSVSVDLLTNGVSRLFYDLQNRVLVSSGVSLEIETPRGSEVLKQIHSQIRNAQLAHQAGFVAAAEHSDLDKLKELLAQQMIPPASVRDPRGRDLWEISENKPEVRALLSKFFGITGSLYHP